MESWSLQRSGTWLLVEKKKRLGNEGNCWDYFDGIDERSGEFDEAFDIGDASCRRQGDHDVNFRIQFRVGDHRYPENGRTHRVADVDQLTGTSFLQYVVDARRYIVITHFVPPVENE